MAQSPAKGKKTTVVAKKTTTVQKRLAQQTLSGQPAQAPGGRKSTGHKAVGGGGKGKGKGELHTLLLLDEKRVLIWRDIGDASSG